MGRMIQIDDFIKELQETRQKFGNTCVYIRDVSWGAVALNRQAEDEAVEHSVHPTGLCPICGEPIAAAALHEFCYPPATPSG